MSKPRRRGRRNKKTKTRSLSRVPPPSLSFSLSHLVTEARCAHVDRARLRQREPPPDPTAGGEDRHQGLQETRGGVRGGSSRGIRGARERKGGDDDAPREVRRLRQERARRGGGLLLPGNFPLLFGGGVRPASRCSASRRRRRPRPRAAGLALPRCPPLRRPPRGPLHELADVHRDRQPLRSEHAVHQRDVGRARGRGRREDEHPRPRPLAPPGARALGGRRGGARLRGARRDRALELRSLGGLGGQDLGLPGGGPVRGRGDADRAGKRRGEGGPRGRWTFPLALAPLPCFFGLGLDERRHRGREFLRDGLCCGRRSFSFFFSQPRGAVEYGAVGCWLAS